MTQTASPSPCALRRCAPQRGFTLLELLVVVVIAGMTLGLVSFNALPSERQQLQKEAQRIALLMQLARDEAIVRNQPVAFEAGSDRYRFLVRDDNGWQVLQKDELLREREFAHTPVALVMTPALAEQNGPLRIVFGREPVDRPFVLTLMSGEVKAEIRADGIGHFVAE